MTDFQLEDSELDRSSFDGDTLVASDLCAVVVTDPAGVIRLFSVGAERLTGFPAAQVLGTVYWDSLMPRKARSAARRVHAGLSCTEGGDVREVRWRTWDGGEVDLAMVDVLERDAEGRLVRVVSIGMDISAMKRNEAKALLEAQTLRRFFDAIPGIAYIKDRKRRLTFLSEGFTRNFGYPADTAIGRRDEDFLPRGVARRTKAMELSLLRLGGSLINVEGDEAVVGGSRWMIHRFAVGDGDDRLIGGLSMNISAVVDAEERFRAAADAHSDAIAILEPLRDARGKVQGFLWDYVNLNADRLFRVGPNSLLGTSFEEKLPAEQRPWVVAGLARVMETGIPFRGDLPLRGGDSEPTHHRLHGRRAGDYLAIEIRDISHEVSQNERIRRYIQDLEGLNQILETQKEALAVSNRRLELLSATDGLTGLTNHARFQELLDEHLNRCRRYGQVLSLVLIDFDHFKQYNDDFGHPAGDVALRSIALILRRLTREPDVVARYGGEEFAIVLLEAEEAEARVATERIRSAIASCETLQRPVTASFGVATFHGVHSRNQLIVAADEALYRAKRSGRNRVEFAGSPSPG